jgi:hypothetical protein
MLQAWNSVICNKEAVGLEIRHWFERWRRRECTEVRDGFFNGVLKMNQYMERGQVN